MTSPIFLVAVAMAAVALGGCGGGSSGDSAKVNVGAKPEAAGSATAAARRRAESEAPKGASPTLRALYANFPPPQSQPHEKAADAVIKAGEKACGDKTPLQVEREFHAAAAANLSPEQKQFINRIASLESSAAGDPSFTTGQLAADTYQAALPERAGQFGYQGCVYSLAKRLELELAPGAGH